MLMNNSFYKRMISTHRGTMRRCFSSVNNHVTILANSNSADARGARFMQSLKKVSGEDFDYFGLGGRRMRYEGLSNSEIDIGNFNDKTFYTWRKTKQITSNHSAMRWSSWNWINAHYRRNANAILSLLEENDFVRNIYKHKPSVVISFDNEYFTLELMERLNKYYTNSPDMPKKHYVNRFVRDFRPYHEPLIDYMHYTIPKRTATPGGYFFPGQYVGQQGVYDAVKHLLTSDPELRHLVQPNSIQLNEKWFAGDLDKAIQKLKAKFRQTHQIDDDATVIFFAPGNEQNESTFSFESVRNGVQEFLLKYSAPTSLSPVAKPLDKFHTFISLEEGSAAEAHVRELLDQRGWKGTYTVVTNSNNEHLDAMAASDLGIVYDGQMVGAAAVNHLPTMILLDMRMHHQWYHDLFNRWWNEMVTIADKDIYPELIGGQAWFGKI